MIAAEYPAAVVSLSCQVLPEYREYERAMTTLIDAAVKPTVAAYVRGIARRLDDARRRPADPVLDHAVQRRRALRRRGRASADQHRAVRARRPVRSVRPLVAASAGYPSVLTCDGGGTSTDVTVITDGRAVADHRGVGRRRTRRKIPMIDVVTVGAGGGSVAWISPEGALKVGPRSAGADPGPACYRLGGAEPTVTDAHLVLGRIPPHLLGGEIAAGRPPRPARRRPTGRGARAGPAERLRRRHPGDLGLEPGQRAAPDHRPTGLDVRDFPLVTFGGSARCWPAG